LHLLVLYQEMRPYAEQLSHAPIALQQEVMYDPNFALNGATLGASGAVFGCLAAFGYLFPNSLIYLYFFVPIKAKWFVLIYAGMELFLGVRNSAGDNVAHWAHLGGALVGILFVLYWKRNDRRNFY
jgi:membrane associated rhomboid family serine protease